MRLRKWTLAAAALASLAVFSVACGGDDDDDDADPTSAGAATSAPTATPTPNPEPWKGQQVRFGLLPSENAQEVLAQGKFIEDYLEKQLKGLDVKLFVGPAYAATIEAMKANELEFAYFGPFSYVLAKDGGAKIDAALMLQPKDGIPATYWSVIYTRGNSGLSSLADIKAKQDDLKFAFVDAGSTSGYLAPNKMLLDAGVDIGKLQKNQILAGGHDKSALATFQGQTPAGASFEQMLYDLCKQGLIDTVIDKAPTKGNVKGDCKKAGANNDPADDLILIDKFQLPESPFAYRTTMDAKLSAAVIEALDSWPQKEKETFLKFSKSYGVEGAFGWTKVSDKDFDTIRNMCKEAALADICAKKK